MNKILSALKGIVWGVPTLALLLVFGVYFTLKCKFYRPNAVIGTVRDIVFSLTRHKKGGISSFSAVATALGGTVGVGSIVGVGYALAVGGAGSIFWMWVCSFFGMGLKYAEVKVALGGRRSVNGAVLGGAPFRLSELGCKRLAVLFCLLCVAASFGTGNLTQVGAMASFLSGAGMPDFLSALLCASIVALAVFGGRERIAGINTVIVPVACAVYLASCAVILAVNSKGILPAFGSILREAFGFSAVSGGFSGALLAHTVREGFARSLFSNEAGMGSSPLAHATADTESPIIQAKWGIFEIFFDTFVVSTLTALCLLSSGSASPYEMFAFFFGKTGTYLFGALAAVFAFASVISWCYYAECCISFMLPKSKSAFTLYRVLFSVTAFAGVYVSGDAVWEIADILNALMMFPNLFLLYKCRNEIERII